MDEEDRVATHPRRHELTAAVLAIAGTTTTSAACVDPLSAPSNQTARADWNEFLALKPNKNLNSVITSIQGIDTDGVGDVNLDYYAITIDGNGESTGNSLPICAVTSGI